MNTEVMFSSKKDDWETPQTLFDKMNAIYNFSYDLAASDDNTKCEHYFTKENDSLATDWTKIKGNLWLNPPYGRDLRKWVQKAYESSLERQGVIVMLIPSRTDTSYWHDFIFNKAKIDFLRGRLKFEVGGGGWTISTISKRNCNFLLKGELICFTH